MITAIPPNPNPNRKRGVGTIADFQLPIVDLRFEMKWRRHGDDQGRLGEGEGFHAKENPDCRSGRVENWFELLDAWFDVHDETGGLNSYRW
jgi:hypothetical protein